MIARITRTRSIARQNCRKFPKMHSPQITAGFDALSAVDRNVMTSALNSVDI